MTGADKSFRTLSEYLKFLCGWDELFKKRENVNQTLVVTSIGSSESIPSQYLYKEAYNNFSSHLYAPAFETGYYDIFALKVIIYKY